MKVANLAFVGAILTAIPSTQAGKDNNKNNKGNDNKNKALRSPPTNKKPDGDVSDLFQSQKNQAVNKPSNRNVNSKPNQSNNKKPNKKPSGSKPSSRAVDDDAMDDNFQTPATTYIPTYIPTYMPTYMPTTYIPTYIPTYMPTSMPTYYWYDDAIFNLGGSTTSSKGGKSGGNSWGSSGAKAGKSEEVTSPIWWGGSSGGKARKMMVESSDAARNGGSGKPLRNLKAGKAEGLRLVNVGKADKEPGDIAPLTDDGIEANAVFFAYELQTAVPTGFHTTVEEVDMQPLSASIESIETMDESMEEMNHKVGRKHKRDAAGGKANKRKRGGRLRHRGGKSGRQKIKATPIPTLYPTEFPTSTGNTIPTYIPTYYPTTYSSKSNKNKINGNGGKSDKTPMLRSDPYEGKARKLRLLTGKVRRMGP